MEGIERLVALLETRGVSRGEDIQRELGISQPAMSRLIREAGSRVSRFGRSVATRYAASRQIAGLGRRAPVYRVDELGRPTQHGVLHFLARNGSWLERETGEGQFFSGPPPFVEDMRPQGYLGRNFSLLYPELRLPRRTIDWSDDHQLIALGMRGEDCVGNLIIGEESLNRFLALLPQQRPRADYPDFVRGSLAIPMGSSAGGDHPKFAVYSEGRHLLVKFASGEGQAADRWRDLLVCEHLALETLRDASIPVPRSEWFDLDGSRYLEVERFDRVGRIGRRGVLTLFAINCYYLGRVPENWSRAAQQILDEPTVRMDAMWADRLVWLDTFGDLIGNTDRHFGNICFFTEEAQKPVLTPTPVYDMLPMLFAPADGILVERQFAPQPPNALNLRIWHDAATHALRFWSRLCEESALSAGFRRTCIHCRDTLARLVDARRL